jgi:hypothetical protein
MIKLTYLIPVLLFVIPGCFHPTLFAQKNDYFWQVPNSNGIDFRFDPPRVFFLPSSEYSESAASIASDEGEPRFYLDARLGMVIWDTLSGKVLDATAESKIRNKDGILVENGDSIKTDQSISQALVLPQPGKKERYYFFTFWNIEEFVKPCSLYYHVVDGSANSGKGKVIQKNVPLFPQYMAQKITATRHANGKDWWIITHNYTGGKYYVFLLSEQGIAEPLIQEIGLKYEAGFWGQNAMVGVLQFSPQGDKLVNFMGSTVKQIEILYFDRCTGCLSPFNKEIDLSEDWYGGTFSPDGNLLYTNIGTRMIQLDLEASDITSSLTEIGWSSFSPSKYQIAPNGKIYINDSFENYLFSINEPNIKGNACNFKDSALHLNNNMPGMCRIDLPNMPNFRLGASVPTYTRRDTVVCPGDSVVIGLPETCGYAYRWTPGRGLSDSTAAMPYASPRWTTTYTRETYSPRFGCTSRYDVYRLIINEKPVPPCTVTHRNKNISQELFSIHPNPASEHLQVKSYTEETFELGIYNLTGTKLINLPLSQSGEVSISTAELPAGIYILKAGDRFSEKLVIVR